MYFPVWLSYQIILIGLELEPVLSNIEKSCIDHVTDNFPQIYFKNLKINTSFVSPGLQPIGNNKTFWSINLRS